MKKPPSTLASGSTVDHFKVIRLLGQGGFGEVYLARDVKLGRKVALKMVHTRYLGSEEWVEQFLFEARATARFNHPNIVTVYGVGEHEGRPYVALEYLQGRNLRQWMNDRPPTVKETMRIALAVAQALQEAHRNKILHRDLKPENILIPRDGRLRVVDFGLAKIVGAEQEEAVAESRPVSPPPAAPETHSLSFDTPAPTSPVRSERVEGGRASLPGPGNDRAGQARPATHRKPHNALEGKDRTSAPSTVEPAEPPDLATESAAMLAGDREASQKARGSPRYMAPEQWLAGSGTEATDVWALGVLLHELLTGAVPYEERRMENIAFAVCSPDPVPSKVEAGGDGDRAVPEALRDLVRECLSKDPDGRPSTARIIDVLQRLLTTGGQRVTEEQGPYPGLLSFSEEQADFFFGREAEVSAFVEKLRVAPSLAVLGPSGAGKSSFVHAGVIPRLREQGRWVVYKIRPGVHPFRALATALISGDMAAGQARSDAISGGWTVTGRGAVEAARWERGRDGGLSPRSEAKLLARQLRDSPARLGMLLRETAERHQAHVLLLVDQLEELQTHVEDPTRRGRFMEALGAAADDPQEPMRVLVTMRDDFLGRLAESPESREILGRVSVLPSPGPEALTEMLTRPLDRVGYRFEDPELVEQMVRAAGGEPSALPLLQFSARALWDQRDEQRKVLLRSAYEAMGGVEGALASHADSVLDGLTSAQLSQAYQQLLRLVTPEGTRRIVTRQELLEGLDDGAGVVLERLTEARLITGHKSSDEGAEDAVLELAHESLIRSWDRLAGLLEESREERAFLAEVGPAAALWARRGRRDQETWQGAALDDARAALRRCTSHVRDEVREFLAAGQRRRRRGRRLGIVLGIVAVVGMVVAVSVWVHTLQKKELAARKERNKALTHLRHARHESALVKFTLGDYPAARAWLRASLEISDHPHSRRLWWRLEQRPLLWRHRFRGRIYDLAISPDGRRLAVVADREPVRILDLEQMALWTLPGRPGRFGIAAFAPGGKRLATCRHKGQMRLWDLQKKTSRRLGLHPDGASNLAFVPSGKRLVSQSSTRLLTWDLTTPGAKPKERKLSHGMVMVNTPRGPLVLSGRAAPAVSDALTGDVVNTLPPGTRTSYPAVMSANGRALAMLKMFNTRMMVMTPDLGRRALFEAHVGKQVRSMALSRDGKLLAVGTSETEVMLWDTVKGDKLTVINTGRRWVTALAFSKDARRLWVGHAAGFLQLWSVAPEHRHGLAAHSGPVSRILFSPDGKDLVTGGSDGRIIYWDQRTGRPRDYVDAHDGGIMAMAYRADGKLLVTGGEDSVIRLWDGRSRARKRQLRGHQGALSDIAFSPDGKLLATCGTDFTVRLWDLGTREQTLKLQMPLRAWSVAFHPSGKLLAVGGDMRSVMIFEVPSGKLHWEVGPGMPRSAVRFNARGVLAVKNSAGMVLLYDVQRRRLIHRLSSQRRTPIGTLRPIFDRSGHKLMLAAASDHCRACTVDVLDLRDRSRLTLWGGRQPVRNLAIHPRAAMVASVGDLGIVQLWNLDDGSPMWHAPLMLPPLLYRLGSTLDLDAGAPAVPGKRRWQKALVKRARLAHAHARSGLLCIVGRRHALELWDRSSDTRLFARRLEGVSEVQATDNGCAVQVGKRLVLYGRDGASRPIPGPKVGAFLVHGKQLLVARGRRLLIHDSEGKLKGQQAFAGSVTAMARLGPYLVTGHGSGLVKRWSREKGGRWGAARDMTDVVRAPVSRIARGPGDLLMAGFIHGLVAFWDIKSGDLMHTVDLHGSLIHMAHSGTKIYLATELGSYRVLDASALAVKECDLIRRVWREVPFDAKGKDLVPRPVDKKHQCYK